MTNEEAREILIEEIKAIDGGYSGNTSYSPDQLSQAIDVAIRALGDGIKLNDWQKGWLSFNQIDVDLVEKILNSTEPPKS